MKSEGCAECCDDNAAAPSPLPAVPGTPKLRGVRVTSSRIYFSPILATLALSTVTAIFAVAAAQQTRRPETATDANQNTRDAQENDAGAAGSKSQTPAQIELLETHIRFNVDGSSRKEVHAIVRINTELGTRQFARLNFDYNRAFETLEIPLARITHSGGGTAETLPGAITDQPNPAVADAAAYQDVRRKTVRILGLQPADKLEYRVITTATHPPLAPNFYFFHTFAKDAIVTLEQFELDLPAARDVQIRVNPATPGQEQKYGEGSEVRVIRRWEYRWGATEGTGSDGAKSNGSAEPDVALSTFTSWNQLSARLAQKFDPTENIAAEIMGKSAELTSTGKTGNEQLQALYDFVSQKIATVDVPLEATGFRVRPATEILSSGYATAEDKMVLLAALIRAAKMPAIVALAGAPDSAEALLPRPSMFTHFLIWAGQPGPGWWLDPGVEVAPFAMIAVNFRGKHAFLLLPDDRENSERSRWLVVPDVLPFAASQHVSVDATLALDGKLNAKVHYALRGDNELLLRVAFHQTDKEKWKDLAQLLSISDGFRGKVVNVSASDPSETRQPFTVDYEIVTSKFVDWSKKPVRIPALLPQVGLPEGPAKPERNNSSISAVDLGTPLDVDTRATLRLPPGTSAHAPTGTSVERDYATFSSQYEVHDLTLTASRQVRFLLREVPAPRVADYKAFMHAVQNDEGQDFTLERADNGEEPNKPAVKKTSAAIKP